MRKVAITVNSDIISRTNEVNGVAAYNDPTKYITFNKTDETIPGEISGILQEFPEFAAGKTATVTNTGLVVFKEVSTSEAYDLLDETNITLEDIRPDFTSTSSQYDEYNNPLGVRKIRVNKDLYLEGDVYYSYISDNENHYVFAMDTDYYYDNTSKNNTSKISPNSDGMFDGKSYQTTTISLNYKQHLSIKFINCIGTVTVTIKNDSDNIYSSDTSTSSKVCLNFDLSDNYANTVDIAFKFSKADNNAYVEIK